MIKSLYSYKSPANVVEYYFQKSRVFLYPLLGIVKSNSIVPIENYVSWVEGGIKRTDCRLLSVYHIRGDSEYKIFEEKLKTNSLFHSCYEIEDNRMVYLFNFDGYNKEWKLFLEGKYSKYSGGVKSMIMQYYKNSTNKTYVESFLYPSKFYAIYSEVLGVSQESLKTAVELTDPPDFQRETLNAKLLKPELL